MRQTYGGVSLLFAMILSACAQSDPTNCSLPWPGFQPLSELWRNAIPIDPVKNVIRIERSGKVTWNDVDVTENGYQSVIDLYLHYLAQMDGQPPTILHFEKGASCSIVNDVRGMMTKHLQCERSLQCFQGSV